MKYYLVQFFYKDSPSYHGLIEIVVKDNKDAFDTVNEMICNRDERIPGNWDRYEIKDTFETVCEMRSNSGY